TTEVKARAAALRVEHEADAALSEMLEKLSQGIPVEGMEALIPVMLEGELELLTDAFPAGTHVVLADPERIVARAHALVRTRREFLEASWSGAAAGGQAPIDLGASAYRDLAEIEQHAKATGRCWWTLSQLTTDVGDVIDTGVQPAPGYRGDFPKAAKDLRAHTA